MRGLPSPVLDYVHAFTLETRSPAYLQIDNKERLRGWGGTLSTHGISVDDKGRGVPQDRVGTLFEKFSQGEGKLVRPASACIFAGSWSNAGVAASVIPHAPKAAAVSGFVSPARGGIEKLSRHCDH